MGVINPPATGPTAGPPAGPVPGHAAPRADDGEQPPLWHRPVGVELLGQVSGSGLREPTYLVQRPDGQLLQVTELMHHVLANAVDGQDRSAVATAVGSATGRTLPLDVLDHLARTRLVPLGLLVDATRPTPPAQAPRADPLLALRLHGTLLPARIVRVLARALTPLYWPPVVALALAAAVVLDVMLWRDGHGLAALDQVIATPEFLLLLFALLTGSAVIHELGHATACRYGGAEPGRIGVGVYLLFPAFFTDVTASYRLGRGARLRTDLGGLYFNVWCLLALGGTYLATGHGVLLLAVILLHVEMAQQLIPTVRFDGYFVLADLAGVPDLFGRLRPVLRSLVPGRRVDPRVAELLPAARAVITGWVLLVVPSLVLGFGWLAWHLPEIVTRAVSAIHDYALALVAAWSGGQAGGTLLAALAIALLSVPLLGVAVVVPRLLVLLLRLVRSVGRRLHAGRPGAREAVVAETAAVERRSS